MKAKRIAIIGGGNLGSALAQGWKDAGTFKPKNMVVTRRHPDKLSALAKQGIRTGRLNQEAVLDADIIVLAIQPGQLDDVLADVSAVVDAQRHVVISTLTGVSIERIAAMLPPETVVVRAMPNTAVETRTSMTCLAVDEEGRGRDLAQALFEDVGATLFIEEEMMIPATALCACGIAFFLRTIRAAAQGGTEIGFHADEALLLAAQTARGAADLILLGGAHPEQEIDRVTTPRGCTIAGLNELEHRGFSSAMIRGILTSAERAAGLG